MGLPIYLSQQDQQCPHPTPHCHRHDSRPRGWRAEGRSWERRPRGRAPPAARHTPQDRDHIFLHSHQALHFPTFPHNSQPSSPFERRPAEWTRVTPRAGKRALCCRSGEPGNPTPVVCVDRNPTQFYVILHYSTRSYTILQDPTQSYTTLRPYLHVSKSYSSAAIQHFPAIHLKFAKTC